MTDNNSEQFEEQRLAELLRLTSGDAVPVDADELARIREDSLAAFVQHANSTSKLSPPTPSTSRFAMKIVALLSTAVLTLLGVWIVSSPSEASSLKLGEALAKLENYDAVQLQIKRGDSTANVWVQPSGAVRWEESASKYQIARGSRLWKVDEENEAVESGENEWRNESGKVDLLALLDVSLNERTAFLSQLPSGHRQFAGRDCVVYRRIVNKELQLEVFVDNDNAQLVGMTARNPLLAGNQPPLAELSLVAVNPIVDEDKFRVPVKLAELDYIGKVVDTQGIITLRPQGARRWTPLCRQLLVQPGDWIRTDTRGANASTIILRSGVKLILGPGSLIELISQDEARLHSGSAQITRTKKTPNAFQLLGQGDDAVELTKAGKALYELNREAKLAKVAGTPMWLQGYEGTSAEDSIGSLIVNIDGRATPLTVGEHHVTVEIRDQIARTTIEETFVNHTRSRMEGTFHFPLPQDASISGFGMWIGGELVEADIVEKQRAREIYETILREKRDPGLLEWTGGNIFKARVFPIEARSEKRVKIVYTQVLPMRGNKFRYSYGLKSEMLATTPLRDLNLKVIVNSAVPLVSVESPTHTCRTAQTDHSAELEFSAQEYTPTKDFEVVCEVNHHENDVLVIPHQRGDDGYFLMQLMPPGEQGDWQREVIPDGDPLKLIVLCDTSGSMDSSMRETQQQFVTSLLTSLGPQDKFALAACDVSTVWAADDFARANEKSIAHTRYFLDQRISLGWTDLEQAFAAVTKKASADTQIIYVGDGIVNTTDSDAARFVNRLKRQVKAEKGEALPTFHAVSVGSSYESIVLKGIAALGGGSTRQISGETTPQQTALELLNEMAQPGLKNVKVDFRGVKVAAVYPGQLPNISAGTQQILVGRYLPEGNDQSGEVIVTGLQDGKPVTYKARIEFKESEAGNSFIPRLWARAHLETLLQSGTNQMIQDEIIALSEEFHIITPYTSLLVLESDADRERFGVKRRFEMRDGERFFAEGRNNANYELRQKQMQRAGNWRLGLRREILAEYATLGRDPKDFGEVKQLQNQLAQLDKLRTVTSQPVSGSVRLNVSGSISSVREYDFVTVNDTTEMWWGGAVAGGGFGGESFGFGGKDFSNNEQYHFKELGRRFSGGIDTSTIMDFEEAAERRLLPSAIARPSAAKEAKDNISASFGRPVRLQQVELYDMDSDGIRGLNTRGRGGSLSDRESHREGFESKPFDAYMVIKQKREHAGFAVGGRMTTFDSSLRTSQPNYTAFVRTLFPMVPPVIKTPKVEPKRPEHWSEKAVELSKSLQREEALQALGDGIELHIDTQVWNYGYDDHIPSSALTQLYSANQRFTRSHGQGQQPLVNWCDEQQRVAYSESFLLGTVRETDEGDFKRMPLNAQDGSVSALHELYRNYSAEMSEEQNGTLVLTLTHLDDESRQTRITINTNKHTIIKQEEIYEDKVTQTLTHSDFIEVAGLWWAKRSVTTTPELGPTESVIVTRTIKTHKLAAFQKLWKKETAKQSQVQFLNLPAPTLSNAKVRIAAQAGTFEDHFLLLLHHVNSQKWEDAFIQLRTLEGLAVDKPGMPWLRIAIEQTAGRNADAKQHLEQQLEELATSETSDLFLANYTLNSLYGISNWNDYGTAVAKVKPIYGRQSNQAVAQLEWNQKWITVLANTGKTTESLALQKQIAEEFPKNVHLQIQYANALWSAGRSEDAFAFLDEQIAKLDHWRPYDINQLRENYAGRLEKLGHQPELLAFLETWLQQETEPSSVFARYLTALVMNEKIETCDETVSKWLHEVDQPGKLDNVTQSRIEAAIQFCFGQSHNLNRYHGVDQKWFPELSEITRICLPRQDRQVIADRITSNSNFSDSDEGDRIRGVVLNKLMEDAETMPLGQLMFYIDTLNRGRLLLTQDDKLLVRQVTTKEWVTLGETVRKRWEAEESPLSIHYYAGILTSIYESHQPENHLPFLRVMVSEGPEKYRSNYREQLFTALKSQDWTPENEAELLELWPSLSEAKEGAARNLQLIPRLYELVDSLVSRRIAAANQAIQDNGKTDELTRTERQVKQSEFIKAAREGVAESLTQQWKKHEEADSPLADWIMVEKLNLDMLLDRNQQSVLAWCWDQLGDAPPAIEIDQEFTHEEQISKSLQSVLRKRAWSIVQNLSVRKKASPKLVNRVLKYIDSAIEQAKTTTKQLNTEADDDEPIDLTVGWKRVKYNFLIALDRPDELETALKQWINTDQWNIPWRRALANLSAERGEIEAAIQILESIENNDELSPADYQILANLYLVQDQREKYERSRIQTYKAMQEYQLSNFIAQTQNRTNQQQGPHELDEEVLFAYTALFEKTSNPANYYYRVQSTYTSTLDFRSLAMVPESLLGRTQDQMYGCLQTFKTAIVEHVRKESTADEMLATLTDWRKRIHNGEVPRGADPNEHSKELDLRALDLIEVLLERQSAKVLNQPGPHADNALAALQRAFKTEWQDGEKVLYAWFLRSLGRIAHEKSETALLPLQTEQLRQLKQLYDESKPASDERVIIGQRYADLLFTYYEKRDEGLRFFKTVIDEVAAANDGLVPFQHHTAVTFYAGLLQHNSRFEEAEAFLQKHMDATTSESQHWVYVIAINHLHVRALHSRGRTSLGEGEELFDNLIARLEELCATNDDNHRYHLLTEINNHFNNVLNGNYQFKNADKNLLKFVNQRLPQLLEPQHSNYQYIVQQFGQTIRHRINALEALSYLLDRMEEYPMRYEYTYQNAWQQHAWQLAEYRHTAANQNNNKERLAKLEQRLLPLVLKNLREELINQRNMHRAFYDIDHSYFWKEKAGEFLKLAEEILKERKDSPRIIAFIAKYMYEDLDKHDRAIEVLLIAERSGLLDDNGLSQLIGYLHSQSRYAESIALLEPYVDRRPDTMSLRVLLMRAYYYTKRQQQLNELISATDEHFHQAGRWNEGHIVEFARVCDETKKHKRAVGYFEEAINLHQRSQPNRGIGNGTLSRYYRDLANAYSDLGETDKAVDAASAAIVSWGSRQEDRANALNDLLNVLRSAKDLPKYIQGLDAKAKKTGQDSPILRKALGKVFQDRKEWKSAITQYKLAVELQPTDRDLYQALITCFDQLEETASATQQLLTQIDFDKHNLQLYVDLANRLQADEHQAERAATSIVESAPNEAESHQALAMFRTEQEKYQQAIPHWKKVAELRKLEPTGLLGLAETQAKMKDWNGLKSSLKQLRENEWPARFNTLQNDIRNLENKLKADQ